MNENPDLARPVPAPEAVEDPWLEVVRRHEAFLARRREPTGVAAGTGPTGASLFWCCASMEEDRAA